MDRVAANKVHFEESSVSLPPVKHEPYVLNITNQDRLDALFFNLFFGNSARIVYKGNRAVKVHTRSLANYIMHLLALDYRRYFAKFMIKLVFSSRFNTLTAADPRKAP